MSDGLIVTRVGNEPLVDVHTLAGALQSVFPGDWRTWDGEGAWPMSWSIDICPPGQSGFLVSLGGDRTGVHCDGTDEQCAVVAAAVAQVASGTSRLIGCGGDWAWHVDLYPGITPEQVLAGKVVHDEHWSDPELESS